MAAHLDIALAEMGETTYIPTETTQATFDALNSEEVAFTRAQIERVLVGATAQETETESKPQENKDFSARLRRNLARNAIQWPRNGGGIRYGGGELTTNYDNSPLARLKPEQVRAIEKLMTTKSVAGAARAAGIAPSTLRRWLTEPDSQAALVAFQQGRFDELNREALRLGRKAFRVLEDTMDDATLPDGSGLERSRTY